MNFKLKALVAAAAMAASMSASADVATAQTGNGEMTFQIWDATVGSESSYTLDTGVNLTSFLSGVTANQAWNFAVDTTYTNWFNSLSAAAQSGLKWNVAAGDNSGAQTYLTTAPVTFDNFTGSTSFTNSQARNLGLGMNVYLGGVNAATPGTLTTDNLSVSIAGKANTGYAGNFGGNWGNYQTLINTASSVGGSLNLYKITTPISGSAALASSWTQQKFGSNDYQVTFNGSNLNIASVAAVPEADTSAMMLAGLGLMGFIARRRSSKVA